MLRRILLRIIKGCNAAIRVLAMKSHAWQMRMQYQKQPSPEWFDHYLDLYYQWAHYRSPLWLERGLFSALSLKENGNVLELCCGDGFNTKYFYSIKAKEITAVDMDEDAIKHARTYNNTENIIWKRADIRHEIPDGHFDNVVWDAAIEHFSTDDINHILKAIHKRLTPEGILSGYTIVRQQKKGLRQHKYEFESKEELAACLAPYFRNVKVFETKYPTRHNLYFWASDSVLPFDAGWQFQTAMTYNNEKVRY